MDLQVAQVEERIVNRPSALIFVHRIPSSEPVLRCLFSECRPARTATVVGVAVTGYRSEERIVNRPSALIFVHRIPSSEPVLRCLFSECRPARTATVVGVAVTGY